jgi:hypothetical protein
MALRVCRVGWGRVGETSGPAKNSLEGKLAAQGEAERSLENRRGGRGGRSTLHNGWEQVGKARCAHTQSGTQGGAARS